MASIEERIKQIMSVVLDVDKYLIKEDSSTDSIENWDSMNHMNLIVALEEEFECEFDEEDIEDMINFSIIKNKIEK